MRVLFISNYGDGLSLAMKVDSEGHTSIFYVREEKCKRVGDGLVEKVDSSKYKIVDEEMNVVESGVKKLLKDTRPDLVVFDMVKLGKVATYIKSLNYPVFGGDVWADNAELDRAYGYRLMKVAGIKTPPTYPFKKGDTDRAIEFVRKTKKRYVYKPSGNIQTSHTYVAKEVDDLVEMLDLWRNDECDFELQEFVEGVEVSCELWWNGETPLLTNITFEEKKFMNGGIGPTVGCAGNVVMKVDESEKIVQEGIYKMVKLLKKTRYRGPIDLNSIVNEDGLFGLEFTVRFGYDAVQTLMELYMGDLTSLLSNLSLGLPIDGKLSDDLAIGVRLSIPPYPNEVEKVEDEEVNWTPIFGVNNENKKHIWFGDVRKVKDKLYTAGADGAVLCATARGRDVKECKKRVYRTISNLNIPQMQYRTDIGDRVISDFSRLSSLGFVSRQLH